MIFNSFDFLIFFPIVILLYRILPKKTKWVMLLASSYFFYMYWKADLIYLILFTTVVSYLCALGISKAKKSGTKKLLLIIGIVASLSVLFFFKYFNFLSDSIHSLLSAFSSNVPSFNLDLILPVGISFYTFQTLSYVIDVYKGKMPAEKHFGYYALYVSYFPQLVAGPIERPENLIPQLKEYHPFNYSDTVEGLKLMAVGFFKKIAVADQLAVYVNAVYNDVSSADGTILNGFTVALATIMFAFQIYCDFSGYTDIAIGCARLMGIRLMQNFNDPYSAKSIREFWRRWHISLTSWFTDYIYIPLGGSRCSLLRHCLNIMIVFLVSGIWHGAAWTFVLWGGMHGIFQIVSILTDKPRSNLWKKLGVGENSRIHNAFKVLCTFILCSIAWVAFRANSLSDMAVLYKNLFIGWKGIDLSSSLEAMGLGLMEAISAVMSIVCVAILDRRVTLNKDKCSESVGISSGAVYVVLCWAIAAAWLILLSGNLQSSFIYFQF